MKGSIWIYLPKPNFIFGDIFLFQKYLNWPDKARVWYHVLKYISRWAL